MQESKQTNAAAVITAKTLAIREQVQKAAEQRQLTLAPVVREAIVRRVQRGTAEDATTATQITTLLDVCKEKLPVIEERLQTALAASNYCSDALPQEMQPAVMVAVLDGEEVAAAVEMEVERAEEEAEAQAEAATQANSEVLPVIKSDQAPQRQQQGATTEVDASAVDTSAEVAQGAGFAAPQEEKLAQAVWDTSDLSGSLEPAAYNPYAPLFAPTPESSTQVEAGAHPIVTVPGTTANPNADPDLDPNPYSNPNPNPNPTPTPNPNPNPKVEPPPPAGFVWAKLSGWREDD